MFTDALAPSQAHFVLVALKVVLVSQRAGNRHQVGLQLFPRQAPRIVAAQEFVVRAQQAD